MRLSPGTSAYAPAGFFVMRAALLPFAALGERQRWSADAVVRDAIWVASPGLVAELAAGRVSREGARAVLRYVARMAGRATPFGLCATSSVGRFGGRAMLDLPAKLRTVSRLGMAYLETLVAEASVAARGELRFAPNDTVYPAGDRLRYLERRARGETTSFALVSVEAQSYVAWVLARARGGATLDELAAGLVAEDAEIDRDEARAFVELLVEEQLLVATWAPTVSGDDAVASLIAGARGVAALREVEGWLRDAAAALAAADAAGPGALAAHHGPLLDAIAARGGAAIEASRRVCVDAFRDGDLQLPASVGEALLEGVDALRRLGAAGDGALAAFKARFAERYERRAVPLLEALDDDAGIGVGAPARPGQTTGPLLDGFAFADGPRGEAPFEAMHRALLGKLEATWRSGARELVLDDDDVAAAAVATPAPVGDAFGVLATIVAPSAEAIDAGAFRVVVKNVHGPNGAVSVGRFAHGDAALADAIRAHLRDEEMLAPDVVLAEIVHLPPGHQGNVSRRPRLRRYEIPVLGATTAPAEDQITLDDLWVSVEHGRIVLRSRRLGREVRPRLGNLDNYATSSVGAYRFLCLLQNEQASGLRFRWGPLRWASASLPRVVYRRAVLALALWNLPPKAVAAWAAADDAGRFAAVQAYRAAHALPRWVSARDEDKQIPIDLDDAEMVDVLVRWLKQQPRPSVEEVYPGPDELAVRGAGGGYVHEVIVPFARTGPREAHAEVHELRAREVEARAVDARGPDAVTRRFAPGSAWLYAKLYGGPTTLDRLLAGAIGDALEAAVRDGAAARWFFIRYRDPEPHLRLRVSGDPRVLDGEVWPALRAACRAALDAGLAWRLVLDTYEREVERYGGPAGIELAEQLFCADSAAALAVIRATPGSGGADLRWRLALRGLDALLGDLGLSLDEQAAVVARSRQVFGVELRADDRGFRDQLDARYRRERLAIEAWLARPLDAELAPFAERRAALAPIVAELRARPLTVPLGRLAGSFLHMHANRMFIDDARAQELILYDFLARAYRSRAKRR